jgi:N-acetylornithine carbamoyltransferase
MARLSSQHLLDLLDLSPEETWSLAEQALRLKRGEARDSLEGRFLSLLFFNPSVRTRVSCEAAAARLGAAATAITAGTETWNFEVGEGAVMDGETQEHVRELAPVLSRYSDWIGVRRSERISVGLAQKETPSWETLRGDGFLRTFAKHSEVPVLNLESNFAHPLQGLADLASLHEQFGGSPRGKRYVLSWAWHPKALPMATPHSQLVAACDAGCDVVLARPEGWSLDGEVLTRASERAASRGGSLSETSDLEEALDGAQIVCAKSWGATSFYGKPPAEEASAKRELRSRWIIDEQAMQRTQDARFMHCLPVRRNVVVTDGVLDSRRSLVIDQAENRMWTAAAALCALLEE